MSRIREYFGCRLCRSVNVIELGRSQEEIAEKSHSDGADRKRSWKT